MSSDLVGRVFVHKVNGGRYRVTRDSEDILQVVRLERVTTGVDRDMKAVAVDRFQFLSAHTDEAFATEAAAPIAAGHTVRLKCGGLAMVVETVVNNAVWCLWHDQEGRLCKEAIALGCLQRAE